jgi:hypothetical protein
MLMAATVGRLEESGAGRGANVLKRAAELNLTAVARAVAANCMAW